MAIKYEIVTGTDGRAYIRNDRVISSIGINDIGEETERMTMDNTDEFYKHLVEEVLSGDVKPSNDIFRLKKEEDVNTIKEFLDRMMHVRRLTDSEKTLMADALIEATMFAAADVVITVCGLVASHATYKSISNIEYCNLGSVISLFRLREIRKHPWAEKIAMDFPVQVMNARLFH